MNNCLIEVCRFYQNSGSISRNFRIRSAVFGIVLGEQARWGQGYGTDATRATLRFAFRELNLNRVELDVYDFNARAQRCYEKAGFRREGTRRQAHFHDGKYHDVHVMSILQNEFQEEP